MRKRKPGAIARTTKLLAPACLVSVGARGWAQEFPFRPITIVVPFPPGGGATMSRMPALRSVLALAIILLVTLWAVPAYPWHGTGNITALAIDSQRPTTLYAGTSDRGVFKTTDGGATWSATGLANVYVNALAIDPQTPSVVHAQRHRQR
jgi:hypothetical protein